MRAPAKPIVTVLVAAMVGASPATAIAGAGAKMPPPSEKPAATLSPSSAAISADPDRRLLQDLIHARSVLQQERSQFRLLLPSLFLAAGLALLIVGLTAPDDGDPMRLDQIGPLALGGLISLPAGFMVGYTINANMVMDERIRRLDAEIGILGGSGAPPSGRQYTFQLAFRF